MLSINPPGPVSFYFEALIYICTFDPIDIGLIFEYIPVMEFDVANLPTDRVFFSRIGIADRNFVMVLGSEIIFIAIAIATQVIYFFLRSLTFCSKKAG